jgi:hypothetical protein
LSRLPAGKAGLRRRFGVALEGDSIRKAAEVVSTFGG